MGNFGRLRKAVVYVLYVGKTKRTPDGKRYYLNCGEDGLIDYTTDVHYDAANGVTILSSLKDICNADNIKFVDLSRCLK